MRHLLLGLSLSPGIGWQSIHKLIIAGIDRHAFNLSAGQWKKEYSFLSMRQTEALSTWVQEERVTVYIHDLSQQGIDFVTVVDRHYPLMLKEIAFAPWLLFLRGNQELLQAPSLAVVGSRKTTSYGRLATEKLVPELVKAGWGITSGLALGIDSIAHKATLAANGKGIAVLGCGIDQIYPAQNKHVYHTLIKQGLIVSEYPPGTKARPGFFPQRNRIIAGLSYGVIVVEAAMKSGSLITAQLALEQGREVFAVPGSIFTTQSVGTNLLIQKLGAKLITNQEDILEEFTHIDLLKEKTNHPRQTEQILEGFNIEEKKVLAELKQGKRHLNDLQTKSNLPFATLSKVLLKLELKGEIRQLPGSYYMHATFTSEEK